MARNRILVVEDDEAISRVIVKNLISTGYAATPIYDGKDAAELLRRDADFDLALLDIMLPGIDGFALMGYMKHHDIPVIYLTAKSDLDSKIQRLRDGADDYIVKPFEVLALRVRLEKEGGGNAAGSRCCVPYHQSYGTLGAKKRRGDHIEADGI